MANFLFGTNTLPTVNTSQNVTTNTPTWYQQYLNQLLGTASDIAGQPYQPYGQARIADFTAPQTQAFQNIQNMQGSYQPTLNAATNAVSGAANPSLDPTVFNSYMNPYQQQVSDRIATLGGRNLSENILPAINDEFAGHGQFGSDRQGEIVNRAARDTQDSILAAQGNLLNTGFTNALSAYNEGQGRSLAAGQQLGNLSQLGQNLGIADAAALEGVGSQQQNLNQQNLSLAYQDFLNQRDYPRQNVAFLSNALQGLTVPTSSDTTVSAPATQSQLAPSPLAQLAGAGIGAYGLSQLFKARGGAVRKAIPKMSNGAKARPKSTGAIAMYADGGEVEPMKRGGEPEKRATMYDHPGRFMARASKSQEPETEKRDGNDIAAMTKSAATVYRAKGGRMSLGSYRKAA